VRTIFDFHPSDIFNPARNWGWISGWKYAFPPLAALGDYLFGSFVGARVVTAVLGVATLLIVYCYSKLAIADLMGEQEQENLIRWRALTCVAAFSIALPFVSWPLA
jgi:hypothetical protein